jgi:hypothetical protein
MSALGLRQACDLRGSLLEIIRLREGLDVAFLRAIVSPLWDRGGTPAKMQHRG